MDEAEALAARYEAGERISFGRGIQIFKGLFYLHGTCLPLCTLEEFRLNAEGNAEVRRLGWDEVPFVVKAGEVDDIGLFVRVVNQEIRAIPAERRSSSTGWPRGSIGEISAEIGYDVRDLLVAGYTDDQIRGLRRKEYTLDELCAMRPKGPPMVLHHKPGSRRRKPSRPSG
jgi:hypothetical protein